MSLVLEGEYMSASEAAAALGVSVQTLYVYVGRKGIRSQAIPGSRQRRYWKADIERVVGKRKPGLAFIGKLSEESRITLITEDGPFYCGKSVAQLAATATFEETAALLWGRPVEEIFTADPPTIPPLFAKVSALFARESEINRATALLPLLEEANPRAFDMSSKGMARSGADIVRALAAIMMRTDRPTGEPLHQFLARELDVSPIMADLIRRLLVLSADHGLGTGSVAVRAVASTGVTPWRVVISGLTVSHGRRAQLDNWHSAGELLGELLESRNPAALIAERLTANENLPGFVSPLYPRGDPRTRVLLGFFAESFAANLPFQRLADALEVARNDYDRHPNFSLISQFADRLLGLGPSQSLFHLGRSAGWIAHGIEQYQLGEAEHVLEVYTGPLPN